MELKIEPKFLCFSDRKELIRIFNYWCVGHNVSNCPHNLIVFLDSKDLLKIDETKKFIGGIKCQK